MSETKLLSCPFCGGENLKMGSTGCSMGTDVYIKCTCGAKIQMCEEYGSEKLIKAWNTRKPIDDIVEQLYKNGHKMSEAKMKKFGKGFGHIYYRAISVRKAIEIVRNAGKEVKP